MKKSKQQLFVATENVLNTLIESPDDVCPVTCAALALAQAFHEAMPDGGEPLEVAVHKFLKAAGGSKLSERLYEYYLEGRVIRVPGEAVSWQWGAAAA